MNRTTTRTTTRATTNNKKIIPPASKQGQIFCYFVVIGGELISDRYPDASQTSVRHCNQITAERKSIATDTQLQSQSDSQTHKLSSPQRCQSNQARERNVMQALSDRWHCDPIHERPGQCSSEGYSLVGIPTHRDRKSTLSMKPKIWKSIAPDTQLQSQSNSQTHKLSSPQCCQSNQARERECN